MPALVYSQEKPNVIVIYVDDMGYGDLSCYGGEIKQTPNIDKLANEGIRFTQYYTASPVSSPSRVGITTGMHPLSWQINTFLDTKKANKNCEQKDYLEANAPSMARAFQQAGYATGHFGKWHMGGGRDVDNAPSITSYGFDEYASTWESPDPDPVITSSNWIWAMTDSVKRWERTAYFIDKSLDFIKKNNKRPFFINLWPDDVHTPWVPDKQSVADKNSHEKRENLVSVLSELDKQIGRLTDSLSVMGILDNTIILLTSDNGPAPSFEQTRTLGMRGTKNSLYEGGIKMPLIVRWGNKIKAGTLDEKTVLCSIDFYPSLCRMAGIDTEKNVSLHGKDMAKALTGKKTINRKGYLFWDFGRNQYFNFPRNEKYKSPHLAIRKGDWKLLCNSDGKKVELYNLIQDKNETENLSGKYPKLTKELTEKLIEWYNKK